VRLWPLTEGLAEEATVVVVATDEMTVTLLLTLLDAVQEAFTAVTT